MRCTDVPPASAFDQDISAWSVDNVRDMHYMFGYASAFDQDLGWCVDNDVNLDDVLRHAVRVEDRAGAWSTAWTGPF